MMTGTAWHMVPFNNRQNWQNSGVTLQIKRCEDFLDLTIINARKTFGKERQIFIFTLYYQSSIHHHATVYYFVLCNKFFVHYTGKLMLRKKIVTKITKKKGCVWGNS